MNRPDAGLLLALLLGGCSTTRGAPDADLQGYVDAVKAIDAHAHPLAVVPAGAPADTDFDALPLDGLPPFALPWGLNAANPAFRDAQRALFGLAGNDTGVTYLRQLDSARTRVMREHGDGYAGWALDQAGIDVMLANRVAMGRGLSNPRFRWVSFADALMLPLDTRGEAARTPDTRVLYPLEAKLLKRYLADLGLPGLPATLDAYERQVVAATLERQKASGAVGIKFEAAYLRRLDFAPADSIVARAVYARYVRRGVPAPAEYKLLEDYLFRVIAQHAGLLGLTVQVHMIDGFGGFYDASGSAPQLMEPVFNDSTLRGTRFVIVHGGWPRVEETLAMLAKPNVYADISMMGLIAEPAAMARALRLWLAAWPDKVMFGTDAFDGGARQGWEQVAWLASRNARRVLASALALMVRDAELTPERAREIATMVMRGNALAVYRLGGK